MKRKVAVRGPWNKMRVFKLKKVFETAIILVGTIGWWGFVYPELSLVEESAKVDFAAEKDIESDESTGIKSWVWEYICQMREENEGVVKAAECEEGQ